MQDGEGMLADGTRYKRESGETKGKNGYWYRWTKLSGISRAGQVRALAPSHSNSQGRGNLSPPWQ